MDSLSFGETSFHEILKAAALPLGECELQNYGGYSAYVSTSPVSSPNSTTSPSESVQMSNQGWMSSPARSWTQSSPSDGAYDDYRDRLEAKQDLFDPANWLELKHLRDTIVALYFRHVHPLCPIVDDVKFQRLYNVPTQEEFFRKFPRMVFLAMVFAACSHLDDVSLRLTQFASNTQAQEKYYREAEKLYRFHRISSTGIGVELCLAQTALLLSYWAPQDAQAQANSFWADRAIYHAHIVLASSDIKPGKASSRLRILYWCCHVRNTLISYALRRPYRLHSMTDQCFGQLFSPDELVHDFGIHRTATRFADNGARIAQMHLFVWMCHLCLLLNSAMSFHGRETDQAAWKTRTVNGDLPADEDERMRIETMTNEGLTYFALEKFEFDITELSSRYLRMLNLAQTPGFMRPAWVGRQEIVVPLYTVLIITHSSIACLYTPIINRTGSSDSDIDAYQRSSFQKIQKASLTVSALVEDLLTLVTPETMPIALVAWIILPMAVLWIVNRNRNGDDSLSSSERTQATRSLIRFIRMHMSRFRGAGTVWETIRDIHALIDGTNVLDENGAHRSPSFLSQNGETPSDVELLARVMKILDLDLSSGTWQ